MNQLTISSISTIPLPESWVEKMFHKMLLDYGKKFTDQWGGADSGELKAHWAREMASYTGPEIKRGLAAMESRDWPPTLPEFKKMCRAPLNPLTAYHEALAGLEARGKGEAGTWSHPAIYWSASLMRADLQAQTYAQVKDRWTALLQAQFERGEWAEIPAARVLLATPDVSPAAKAHAAKMLAELSAAGITKTAAHALDHRRWAKRIIEREERGDKTVTLQQLKDAREALSTEPA